MKNTDFISYDAVVIGTGAAGYNAAIRIKEDGNKTVAIVTEGVSSGTSRNTGSDKQTYYKLGLGGNGADSVRKLAQDLYGFGAVDGDNALCEAALSTRCFLNLCELGVPFPVNRYGEYVGYKTDHDPYERATSAGPLTSRFMTEALERKAVALDIPVYDGLYAFQILKNVDGVCGLLCIDKATGRTVVFRTAHIILATGGPAGVYADSVYPQCHTGSSSLAFLAGAQFQNLTYWQYGLASIAPRWNVSGTYMQVLPRFASVDSDGNEHEFLLDYFTDPYGALNAVFLKGYQWPFDSSKVLTGSSVIDLLVYRESILLGRMVYLDYRTNPFGLESIDFSKLSQEAFTYLESNGAAFGTPIQRLLHMNAPAYELYLSKGVDLHRELLQIALCAQHCNGGISVDLWWQTTVPGLFAAGECAGTHGISRPGGSALNAGQVGSLRAAQYISRSQRMLCDPQKFAAIADEAMAKHYALSTCVTGQDDNTSIRVQNIRTRMSACGAAIRQTDVMKDALSLTQAELHEMANSIRISEPKDLYKVYQYRDALVCQIALLSSMINFAENVGTTYGSSLYCNEKGILRTGLDPQFRFLPGKISGCEQIQQGVFTEGVCHFHWRDPRPIPEAQDVFEAVWRRYREDNNVY